MIEQSVLLNKIFHFSMRWQQLFSYLRNPTVKVVFKALEPVQLRLFTGCDFVCVPPFFFFLSVCLSPSPSPPLSLSLLCLFLLAKFSHGSHFLLDSSLFVLNGPTYAEVNRQTWASTEIHLADCGDNGSIKWTCILQDRISSFLWYAFIFLKRSFRGLNRAITDTIRMQPIFYTTGLI